MVLLTQTRPHSGISSFQPLKPHLHLPRWSRSVVPTRLSINLIFTLGFQFHNISGTGVDNAPGLTSNVPLFVEWMGKLLSSFYATLSNDDISVRLVWNTRRRAIDTWICGVLVRRWSTGVGGRWCDTSQLWTSVPAEGGYLLWKVRTSWQGEYRSIWILKMLKLSWARFLLDLPLVLAGILNLTTGPCGFPITGKLARSWRLKYSRSNCGEMR